MIHFEQNQQAATFILKQFTIRQIERMELVI